ncbi:MAG: phage portal protein [Ruminococcus sp.]|nr:phage portal protein [Ruminococcus sp.]
MRRRKNIARRKCECYPDFSAELSTLKDVAVQGDYSRLNLPGIIAKIIRKHKSNSAYNRKLCERYQCLDDGVPIFGRVPRFPQQGAPINNQLNSDFFSEIVDFKTGYFAGKPIAYSYSQTDESKAVTGSEEMARRASKALTDFAIYTNLYDVDMQCVKYAAICGYGARLFYIDKPGGKEDPGGKEKVMPILPYQAAFLTETCDISAPLFAVRYYRTEDLSGATICKAEFYDSSHIYYLSGSSFDKLTQVDEPQPHMFGGCPLQGIPNNEELTGDAEKVLSLIDAYDRAISDSSNEIESFAQAYMVFKNIQIPDEEMAKCQSSGAIRWTAATDNADVYFLTKDINDTFLQNFLDRLRDDIYQRSKTPNINDETFGNASGVSLKFKLTQLETKCGMLQAKMQAAGMYMFQLLSNSFMNRLGVHMIPEQCVMEFKRNFPLDALSEAQAAKAMIASGLPKQLVYGNAYSFVDDVSYVMQLIAEEEGDIVSLYKPEEEPEG